MAGDWCWDRCASNRGRQRRRGRVSRRAEPPSSKPYEIASSRHTSSFRSTPLPTSGAALRIATRTHHRPEENAALSCKRRNPNGRAPTYSGESLVIGSACALARENQQQSRILRPAGGHFPGRDEAVPLVE